MTRKRFVKLLMANGVSRNDANEIAKSKTAGTSYKQMLEIELSIENTCRALHAYDVMCRSLVSSFQRMCEAIEEAEKHDETYTGKFCC